MYTNYKCITPVLKCSYHEEAKITRQGQEGLHPDLEPASLGEVLDPLEWLVLLSIHVQPVNFETTNS